MAHPVHIPLDQRKIMAARLIFFEAAEPLAHASAQAGAEIPFDHFRTLYHIYFDSAAKASPFGEALDHFLITTLARHRQQLAALFDAHQSLFDRIWKAIELHTHQMICQACSHLTPQICDGGDYDSEIVDQRGHCIQPLRWMFDFAAQVTETYYSSYSRLKPVYPEVIFATTFCDRKDDLHDFPVPYYVSGVTEFLSCGQMSRVKLRYVPGSFNWDTYAANLYVLLHECVAHAFHSISPSPIDRESLPPFDTFAEGWMDWVAYKVMDEVLNGRGPAAHLVPASNPFTDSLSRGLRYHEARRDIRDPQRSKYATAVYTGGLAAKTLLLFFDKYLYKDVNIALEKFYRLSFDLTMLRDNDDKKKAAFVSLVGNLPADGRHEDFAQEMTIKILERYAEDEDAAALLNLAHNLKTGLMA